MAFETYPGVYVREIDTFPASVAAVATAIPAFLGYVERAEHRGRPLFPLDAADDETAITPLRIGSLLEFEAAFGGGAAAKSVTVGLDDAKLVERIDVKPRYYLYSCLQAFYANGGGDCWIVPIGRFGVANGAVTKDDFTQGLGAIAKVDEPTLLVAPDAVLLGRAGAGEVYVDMLAQCARLRDRFAIVDVVQEPLATTFDDGDIRAFRTAVSAVGLKYGAAYYPYLRSGYGVRVDHDDIVLEDATGTPSSFRNLAEEATADQYDAIAALRNDLDATESTATPDASQLPASSESLENQLKGYITVAGQFLNAFDALAIFTDRGSAGEALSPRVPNAVELHGALTEDGGPVDKLLKLLGAANAVPGSTDSLDDTGVTFGSLSVSPEDSARFYGIADPNNPPPLTDDKLARALTKLQGIYEDAVALVAGFRSDLRRRLAALQEYVEANDPLYARVVAAVRREGTVLPPSGFVAGVYARVDAARGVWKAPANEGLVSVIEPAVNLDNETQGGLNVDPVAGKSINAIRSFPGRGTLVWGARTLAGNDDNWRYVNVRRLFIFLEESIEQAMQAYVFEPNTANTWVKVQTAIENFLSEVWGQGGLAGAKASDAYRVAVGLGVTMTAADVNAGRLVVDVLAAPSRPAEFIVLRFSQLLQAS